MFGTLFRIADAAIFSPFKCAIELASNMNIAQWLHQNAQAALRVFRIGGMGEGEMDDARRAASSGNRPMIDANGRYIR